jgi:hypothetical protein
MGRPYSAGFIRELGQTTETGVGVELARLCVRAHIPAAYIAKALGASRMSVYKWFRGSDIRRRNRKYVEAMVSLMKEDFANGVLPVKSDTEAKKYVESMVGISI